MADLMKLADRVATTMSQASAMFAPAPAPNLYPAGRVIVRGSFPAGVAVDKVAVVEIGVTRTGTFKVVPLAVTATVVAAGACPVTFTRRLVLSSPALVAR